MKWLSIMTVEEENLRELVRLAFITGRLFERDPQNFTPETTENDLINEIYERNKMKGKKKNDVR
ncbi:MAG: hypothetical protein ACI4RJ_03000 [Alphaproteobacteria bacterium]